MREEQVLHVRQGVWIDKRLLRKAGLGTRLQIELSEGQICIQAAENSIQETQSSDHGWEIFRGLGDDASFGSLKNASRYHDRYLYEKKA
ncbi:MAG: hypothetical protein JW925_12560 [Syntrophaceae bacterium]|nr:hypothetical protein [Syntrophaceae bacterium]